MRTIFAAALAATLLAGCGAIGGGEKAAMIKACVESGETDANCSCVADNLEKNLDAETFKVVAGAMAASEEEGNDIMNGLPTDQQGAVMGALMTAGMSCMMGSTEG
jgi:predicted HAD superfamily phosphohydrolase